MILCFQPNEAHVSEVAIGAQGIGVVSEYYHRFICLGRWNNGEILTFSNEGMQSRFCRLYPKQPDIGYVAEVDAIKGDRSNQKLEREGIIKQ